MIIRSYDPTDFDEVKRIHEKYYQTEFNLPNFLNNYICAVTLEDERGIVTTGGIRNIVEAVAVTNKDRSVRVRRDALLTMMQALIYMAQANNHKQLHAFVQDEPWTNHLLDNGFNKTKGQALVLEI